MITLQKAEMYAKEANINGVAAFLNQEDAKDYSYTTIRALLQNLMQAYIKEYNLTDGEMSDFHFSNIGRIANMCVGQNN